MSTWQELKIDGVESDDARLYIEVVSLGKRTEVGVLDSLPIEKVTKLMADVSRSLMDGIKMAGPTKSSVEIGFEFGVENGAMVALIAKGSGKANFKIIMEWDKDAP